jgi:hypothetical protein
MMKVLSEIIRGKEERDDGEPKSIGSAGSHPGMHLDSNGIGGQLELNPFNEIL